MDRKYTYRPSGGPLRRPSRRRRPPWLLWLALGLIIICVVVFLIVHTLLGRSEGEDASTPPPVSSLDSQVSVDPVPQASTPAPDNSMPQQQSPDGAPNDMGTMMVVDGAGYDYYTFAEETTNQYILAVDAAADALAGSATVYSIVVPTSMDIMLSDSYLNQHQVNSSDQHKAIDSYILPSINAINPDVRTVPLFDALRRHCDEHIYFQTDKTWTQLGAYYAYVEFCRAKGIEAVPLEQFERRDYEGFLGGFYSLTEDESMWSETVSAYVSSANTSLSFTDSDGVYYEDWSVISSGDGYDTALLYLIFTAGDQPYKVLENHDISDGSACVVVQDSYGNYFTPFLTSHYQYVYVVDYGLYGGSVRDLVSEYSVEDVIIINSVLGTSSESAVENIKGLF